MTICLYLLHEVSVKICVKPSGDTSRKMTPCPHSHLYGPMGFDPQ